MQSLGQPEAECFVRRVIWIGLVVECGELGAVHACVVCDVFEVLSSVPGAVDEEFEVLNIGEVVTQADLIDTADIPYDLADEVSAVEYLGRIDALCEPARGDFERQHCLKQVEGLVH